VDGQGYRIARAIDWLKLNYSGPLRVDELAARVQIKVGYESPSQFSRKYSRLFGVPPKRDMAALRGKAAVTDLRGSD